MLQEFGKGFWVRPFAFPEQSEVKSMQSRSSTLPAEVDAKGAKAEYKDGVLSLTLPKKANGSATRVATG